MITTRAREGGPNEHRAKQKWKRETNSVSYAPGLFSLSHLSRIFAQPQSFRQGHFTPSIQSNLGLPRTRPPLTAAINTFWIYGSNPFFPHAQTISILSNPLYSLTSFLFQFSYVPLIPNSIQTSQTLHLKNIHFIFSSHLTPHASAPYNAVLTIIITHSDRPFVAFIPILYYSAHFSALPALYKTHSICVPHQFHILHQLSLATPGT